MSTKSALMTLYVAVILTGIALCTLLVLTPILLRDMDLLSNEWDRDFDSVKNLSNEMWTDLLSMGADLRLPRDRLRRQYEEFGGPATSNNYDQYSNYNNYQPQQQLAPTYGYGIAKVKCCCAMKNIDYEGEHRNLPVSYKCPIGSQGESGPPGESGEDGQPGQPGYNGEDYPTFAPASSGSHNSQSYNNNYGSSQYSQNQADDPYGGGATYESQVEKCEPCPRGPIGNPGSKGKPGVSGSKGEKGIQGIHGIPGLPGIQGPPGDVGVRGKTGTKGLPGPRGADGIGGNKGSPGAKGQFGSIGVPGPRGVSGPSGSPGNEGSRGRPGVRGQKGQRGLDGVDGIQGPIGIPGIDAGYCKCPARVRDVAVNNNNYGGSDNSGGYGRQTLNDHSVSRPSGASPPAAVPQEPNAVHSFNSQQSTGTSRPMEHRYGVVSEAIYNPLKASETREYTTSVHVGDLSNNAVQGTRKEFHPQQHSVYQPPRANYYASNQRQESSNDHHSHIRPASPYSQSSSSYQNFSNDENPVVIQDWNDDVRRRQRLLVERQRKQRQRYYGRS